MRRLSNSEPTKLVYGLVINDSDEVIYVGYGDSNRPQQHRKNARKTLRSIENVGLYINDVGILIKSTDDLDNDGLSKEEVASLSNRTSDVWLHPSNNGRMLAKINGRTYPIYINYNIYNILYLWKNGRDFHEYVFAEGLSIDAAMEEEYRLHRKYGVTYYET